MRVSPWTLQLPCWSLPVLGVNPEGAEMAELSGPEQMLKVDSATVVFTVNVFNVFFHILNWRHPVNTS